MMGIKNARRTGRAFSSSDRFFQRRLLARMRAPRRAAGRRTRCGPWRLVCVVNPVPEIPVKNFEAIFRPLRKRYFVIARILRMFLERSLKVSRFHFHFLRVIGVCPVCLRERVHTYERNYTQRTNPAALCRISNEMAISIERASKK